MGRKGVRLSAAHREALAEAASRRYAALRVPAAKVIPFSRVGDTVVMPAAAWKTIRSILKYEGFQFVED